MQPAKPSAYELCLLLGGQRGHPPREGPKHGPRSRHHLWLPPMACLVRNLAPSARPCGGMRIVALGARCGCRKAPSRRLLTWRWRHRCHARRLRCAPHHCCCQAWAMLLWFGSFARLSAQSLGRFGRAARSFEWDATWCVWFFLGWTLLGRAAGFARFLRWFARRCTRGFLSCSRKLLFGLAGLWMRQWTGFLTREERLLCCSRMTRMLWAGVEKFGSIL